MLFRRFGSLGKALANTSNLVLDFDSSSEAPPSPRSDIGMVRRRTFETSTPCSSPSSFKPAHSNFFNRSFPLSPIGKHNLEFIEVNSRFTAEEEGNITLTTAMEDSGIFLLEDSTQGIDEEPEQISTVGVLARRNPSLQEAETSCYCYLPLFALNREIFFDPETQIMGAVFVINSRKRSSKVVLVINRQQKRDSQLRIEAAEVDPLYQPSFDSQTDLKLPKKKEIKNGDESVFVFLMFVLFMLLAALALFFLSASSVSSSSRAVKKHNV